MLEFVREHCIIFIGVSFGVLCAAAITGGIIYHRQRQPKPTTEIQMSDINSVINK